MFRKANEAIAEAADDVGIEAGVPFICECADPACQEIIRMNLDEYHEVRSDPRTFLNVPGHQASSQGWANLWCSPADLATPRGATFYPDPAEFAAAVLNEAQGDQAGGTPRAWPSSLSPQDVASVSSAVPLTATP